MWLGLLSHFSTKKAPAKRVCFIPTSPGLDVFDDPEDLRDCHRPVLP